MICVVLCNCPEGASTSIAQTLVTEELAACVNILPGVTSIYKWEGELHTDPEHTLLIKTSDGLWDTLRQRIEELHPYTTPEIIKLPVDGVNKSYLEWVLSSTRKA